MFQFRRFPTYAYFVQRRLTEYCSAGFPHSVIPGSMPMCGSPRLIAACHDLLRLLMPRHSPCALFSLTFRRAPARLGQRILGSLRIMQASTEVFSLGSLFLPDFLKFHNLLCPLLLALILHSALFSFQGASLPASFKTRSKHSFFINASIRS